MIFTKKVLVGQSENEKKLHETINILKYDMERGFKLRDDDHGREISRIKLNNELAIDQLKSDHAIALDQRDFDLKNNKDQVIMAANKERDEAKGESAVLKKEVEMLRNSVDVNAAVIDVKDLVGNLIKALPKIDLQSLTVNQVAK